jgi:DNA-binding transcriptional LysR family regulator
MRAIRVSLRQLNAFAAVAKTEHFGRAAALLGLSQPTISADIGSLERALGVELFVRSRAGTKLTEMGASLLSRAEDVLVSVQRFDAEAERAAARVSGVIRLAATPSLVNRLVPALLLTVASRDDAVPVEVIEVATGGIIPALAAAEADVGVGHFVGQTPHTKTTWIADDEMCVLSSGGDLDPTRPVDLSTLHGRKLLIWPYSQNREYFNSVIEACRHRGLDPEILESLTHFSGAQSYRLTGREAFSLVPFDFARETSERLSYAPLDPPFQVPLQAIWELPTTQAVLHVIDLLRELRHGRFGQRRPVSSE